MAATQAAENHGDEWGLTWYFLRDICINSNLNPLTRFSSSSSRSTKFKDILPWNIPQMIMKTISISTRIVISYAMKWGIPLWIWWKVNGNWDNNMIRIFQQRESHCRRNTSVRRNKQIQKSRTVTVTVWDPIRKVNHLSKVIWNRKIVIIIIIISPGQSVPPE